MEHRYAARRNLSEKTATAFTDSYADPGTVNNDFLVDVTEPEGLFTAFAFRPRPDRGSVQFLVASENEQILAEATAEELDDFIAGLQRARRRL
jgi:hypothetical protein